MLLLGGKITNCECAWGDGPDVAINVISGDTLVAIDLTADEATELGYKLLNHAKTARELQNVANGLSDDIVCEAW